MSNPYQPNDPNNPYGSQPERGYDKPDGPPQYGPLAPPYAQPVPPPHDQHKQPIQPYAAPYGQQPMAYGGQPGYYTPVAPSQLRPVGVSIIAVLNWIGGILLGLGGLLMFIVVVALGNAPTDASGVTAPLVGLGMTLFLILTGVLLFLCALAVAVGVGLWRLRPWAQITQIVLCVLNSISALSGLGYRGNSAVLCTLVPSIAVIVYLLLPATRAAFRR